MIFHNDILWIYYFFKLGGPVAWQILLPSILSIIILAGLVIFLYKGVRIKRHQICPKNQWTTLVSNFGTAFPQDFKLRFSNRHGNSINGKIIEQRAFWIFFQTPKEFLLAPRMEFHRNWINGRYRLKVWPDSDLEVFIE